MSPKNDNDLVIQRILNSKSLADSEKSRTLLIYLYKEAQDHRVPKEIDIAMDVFQRKSGFNPSEDTIVRVALHKLRQKLSIYYDTDGRRDKEKVSIPKGSYHLVIEKQDRWTIKKAQLMLFSNVMLIILIAILLVLQFYNIQSEKTRVEQWNIIAADDPIWMDLLSSQKPLVVALGNVYLLKDISGAISPGVVFRGPINSDWQFAAFLQNNPAYEGKIEKFSNYHFFPEYSYMGIADLLPSLFYHNVDMTIQPASELTAEQFANDNIIFIGYFKTAIPFHNTFPHLGFEINIELEEIAGLDSTIYPGGIARPANDPQKHHSDISYAAKLPGPNDNTYFLFMGFRLAGVLDVVKQFTTRSRLEGIEQAIRLQNEKIPSYFEVVNRVEGFGREEIRSEILGIRVHQSSSYVQ